MEELGRRQGVIHMRIAGTVSLLLLSALLAGGAIAPAPASAQAVPSYGRPDTAPVQETVHGVIQSVDGAWHLTLRDDRGFVDSVDLRPGTILMPRGVRLVPGMEVTIVGYNGGSALVAFEIDTDDTADASADDVLYYGDGWWYPGYDYGYGPAFLGAAVLIVGGGGGGPVAQRPIPRPYRCTESCSGVPERRRPVTPSTTGGSTTTARPSYRASDDRPAPRYRPAPSASSSRGSGGESRSSAPAHGSSGPSHH